MSGKHAIIRKENRDKHRICRLLLWALSDLGIRPAAEIYPSDVLTIHNRVSNE